jgi:hypothetical protein
MRAWYIFCKFGKDREKKMPNYWIFFILPKKIRIEKPDDKLLEMHL